MKRASQKGVTVRVFNSALTTPVCGLKISSRLRYCRKILLIGLNVLRITYPECKPTIQPGL